MNRDCFKHAMYFGLPFGILFFLHFATSLIDNRSVSMALELIMKIIIPVVAVRLAIDCRRRVNGDRFNYSQGFRYFIRLFLAAALVCSTFIFIYVKWINVDFLTDLKAQTVELVEQLMEATGSSSLTEAYMEEAVNMSYTPRMFAASSFLSNIIIGVIIAIIGSFIVRNDKN